MRFNDCDGQRMRVECRLPFIILYLCSVRDTVPHCCLVTEPLPKPFRQKVISQLLWQTHVKVEQSELESWPLCFILPKFIGLTLGKQRLKHRFGFW